MPRSGGLRYGKVRQRCHLIVTYFIEQVYEKSVELRGFEPLTSCMPCLVVLSDGIALGRITADQTKSVSERVALRLVLPGVVVTWIVTGFPDLGKVDGSPCGAA